MDQVNQTFKAEAVLKNIVESEKMKTILEALKQEGTSQKKVMTSKSLPKRTLN